MKRIGILTAGGDTPALNATIHGAVVRANQLKIELYGFIKGFNSFFNPKVPHVHLNPLFQGLPELDPTKGGTLIGSSRDYVDPDQKDELDRISMRLGKLGIDGVIAIGCVIRGETYHFEVVCNEANRWLMDAAMNWGIPVGNAILTVDTKEQAYERAKGGQAGKGGGPARGEQAAHPKIGKAAHGRLLRVRHAVERHARIEHAEPCRAVAQRRGLRFEVRAKGKVRRRAAAEQRRAERSQGRERGRALKAG